MSCLESGHHSRDENFWFLEKRVYFMGDTYRGHRLSETLIFAIGDTKLMSPIKQNLLPIGDTTFRLSGILS